MGVSFYLRFGKKGGWPFLFCLRKGGLGLGGGLVWAFFPRNFSRIRFSFITRFFLSLKRYPGLKKKIFVHLFFYVFLR